MTPTDRANNTQVLENIIHRNSEIMAVLVQAANENDGTGEWNSIGQLTLTTELALLHADITALALVLQNGLPDPNEPDRF
jgi:hypothetical protein